jgi:hypothetical protein
VNLPSALQHWPLEAIVAIIAGILILAVPRILNYTVAIYLLVVGILGLIHGYGHGIRPQVIIAVAAGVLILIKPSILNYVVGVYLILFGLLEAGILRLW